VGVEKWGPKCKTGKCGAKNAGVEDARLAKGTGQCTVYG